MKSPRQNQSLLAVLGLTVAALAPGQPALQAAVTLDGNDEFMTSGTPTGDLTISGDLSVVKGIDFGTAATNPALAAVQLTYFGGLEHATMFDLTDALGSFQWRDNLLGTARNKMTLDANNLLTLYKSDATGAGILLNPNTGQINLSGTGGGIYAGATPVFTLDASGKLVFGARPLSLTNASASSSSSSGALTVAGGIGVAMDSYINGIRVGRGGGNVATNTAYGVNTLQANTTGGYNTAAGYHALSSNSTGYSNTAAGTYALKSNLNGSSNTATGYSSLYTNSSGAYNTAAGCYSLYTNSTGYSNTAAGYYALFANSTGYSNTAAGYYALGRNSTGYSNTASGASAMGGNSSGYSNTAAGYYALFANTTGISNVAIGSNAGRYHANGTTTLTDPDNSIYLGANARGFSNLDQNSIVIGSAAIGEGANTTVIGNSSTVKTHLYGTVNASTITASAINASTITASTITINNSPVMTACHGDSSNLSEGAILAFGSYANASQPGAVAIGTSAQALAWDSLAIGAGSYCAGTASGSVALGGGQTTKEYSLAAGYAEANGVLSMAFGLGIADGDASIALGGYDWQYGNWPANHSMGENSVTLGGIGNQAMGFSSFASGFWTKATTAYSLALGSLNRGLGADSGTWVDTDPLLELGNGNAPRNWEEPAADHRSNAITTLKNGQTTLTNKAWLENVAAPLADPASPTDSGGEALVVDGHTRLRGKVIIEQAQGDISMGIYGP